jgi:uncharacterized protein YqhQ
MPAPKTAGGQAVIEGVMMRAALGLAVAVRRPSGELVVKDRVWPSLKDRFPIFGLPLVRGIVILIETLQGGLDALNFSAEQAESGRDGATDAPAAGGPSLSTTLTLLLALTLGLGLFVALPHGLTVLVGSWLGGLALTSVWFHLLAGAFKLGIFISYLGALSLLPDVRRLFMYHGAEHKVIAAFEAKEPLDVEHARRHTTFHARCGTSFVLVVVVAAILIFALVFPLLPALGEGWSSHLLAILIKVGLLLPVAGLAYEVNRFAADHLHLTLVRWLVTPGFWLQRLTTREPTDDMLEVGLASLRAALKRNELAAESADESLAVYRDYADLAARMA